MNKENKIYNSSSSSSSSSSSNNNNRIIKIEIIKIKINNKIITKI